MYSAYEYKDGEYVFFPAFEWIYSYTVNTDNNTIECVRYSGDAEHLKYVTVYQYKDGKYVLDNALTDFETNIDDKLFDSYVKSIVRLSENEEIESQEWVEDNVCYRVSIKRTYDIEKEYTHLRDYIFVNGKNGYTYVNVTYPSKEDSLDSDRYVFSFCDFEVNYIDVTFDGNKDLVISLGYQGAPGTCTYCAYIYENGTYKYISSFEDIPNYSINEKEKCIDGWFEDEEYKFTYENGQFVEK